MDVRGVQREQPYWGPKEKASQRLVAHASDAASEEPRPCATRSQSIVQPFHDSARAPRMRALAKPKCKAVARAALKPAYLSHCLQSSGQSSAQRTVQSSHFFTHWQRGTIFAATYCRIHDKPKPVQNIPLHRPAKPQGSDESFLHPLAERNHFCSHILQNPRQSQASAEHSLA